VTPDLDARDPTPAAPPAAGVFLSVAPKSPLQSISSIGGVGTILNVLREVDVRPLRSGAETPFTLAFSSRDVAFADYFAALMYRGDGPQDNLGFRGALSLPLTEASALALSDVVVIITRDDDGNTNSAELALLRQLEKETVSVIVCFLSEGDDPRPLRTQWLPAVAIDVPLRSNTLDETIAIQRIVKAVRAQKAIDDLSLARHLPAFRDAVSKALIDEVAFSNAAYSLGTGVFEVNPITGLPLNIADMVILTKNQALLAYKIALAMGMNADFRSVMPQLAAVVGSGFVFRQLARGLIGLVPGFGLLPKIGIAFAGTYATGEAIRRWCANGERLTPAALKGVYESALERGKDIARSLLDRRVKREPKPPRGLLPRGRSNSERT
jgi:uncharacterized protein (DUF697 family)